MDSRSDPASRRSRTQAASGYVNFEDFKQRIIDRANTRVLAFLNIVGHGMRGEKLEQDLSDMEAKPAADMAQRYRGLIIGIKTAHYQGPEWTPVEHAVEAATLADVPVMVDFGANKPERPISELLTKKLRPGDIYTHCFSGVRNEPDRPGHLNQALPDGRARGVIFDVGHGGGSFLWRVAVPAMKAGFLPDSISTDLHISSMNAGMKDMLNVMSKFLALGMSLDDVVARSTWNPAREIKQETLGHLSIDAPADIAVLRVERGQFGFVDINGARLSGTTKLVCELTIRDGKIVYDLNGLASPEWDDVARRLRVDWRPAVESHKEVAVSKSTRRGFLAKAPALAAAAAASRARCRRRAGHVGEAREEGALGRRQAA